MSSTHPVAELRIVVDATLDLRARPDHRAECVTEVLMGSRLRVLEERGGGRWLGVVAPDGYRAWARSWGTIPARTGWPMSGVYVSASVETIRREPGIGSPAVAPVVLGCRLRLGSGSRRGWRRVSTPDGRDGWIPARSIVSDRLPDEGRFWDPPPRNEPFPRETDFARASLDRVLQRGLSLCGSPYRWGGMSPIGIDCSGFTRLILGLEGIALPRDAKDQAKALRGWWIETSLGRLRAGDLVFFGRDPRSIDHVALALGGGSGRLVHASGRVRISSLVAGSRGFEGDLAGRVCRIARPPW
jgi:hypothetical protein